MNFRFKPPLSGVFAAAGSFFNPKKGKETAEDDGHILIDVDNEGNQLFKEDIIQAVLEDLEKRRTEKAPLETNTAISTPIEGKLNSSSLCMTGWSGRPLTRLRL